VEQKRPAIRRMSGRRMCVWWMNVQLMCIQRMSVRRVKRMCVWRLNARRRSALQRALFFCRRQSSRKPRDWRNAFMCGRRLEPRRRTISFDQVVSRRLPVRVSM